MPAGSVSRGREGDEGFTLMELVVSTSILMIVMTAILGIFESATRLERRTSGQVDNQNAVMIAFDQITREVRGANPIDTDNVVTVDELAMTLPVRVGDSTDNNRPEFRFRALNGGLVKERLDPANGNVLGTITLVSTIENDAAASPLFTYWNARGEEQQLTGPSATDLDHIFDCTVRITIHIIAKSDPVAPHYDASTDVELRNRNPQTSLAGSGCPSGK